MNINKSKRRVLECSLRKSGDDGVKLGKESIKAVNEVCYLGSKVTYDGRRTKAIKCRIAMGRKEFLKNRNLLT